MADLKLVFDVLAKDRASKEFRTIGNAAEDAGDKTSKFGTVAKAGFAAAAAGVALAGVAVTKYAFSAIGAASDLSETLNKSNVIFGENAAVVEKWADGAAQNLGLSKQAALEAATGFGNMLSQLGFTGDESAKLSQEVVKLSADLGSFNNLPTADVADRMSAAFRGEFDSLQALIPNINAARVEQEALAMTGKTVAKELTAQEKATATLAIVQRDGAAAANDFAETSDGLANQQKILSAEFANVKTEIGKELLPVAQAFMGFVLREGVPALKNLVEAIKENKDGIKDFALTTAEVTVLIGRGFLELVAAGLDAFGYLTDGMRKWQGFVFDSAEMILSAFAATYSWVPGFENKLQAAQIALGVYRDQVEGKTRNVADGFHTAADATRRAADAVGGLRDKINTLQAGKTVKINADIREAIGDVDALMRYINSRRGAVRVAGVTGVGGITARAAGGPLAAGQLSWVGERGPELIQAGRDSYVHDAKTSARMAAGDPVVVDRLDTLIRAVQGQARQIQTLQRQSAV